MAGSITISTNNVTSGFGTTKSFSDTISCSGSIGQTSDISLSAGVFQSVTSPAGATAAIISPASSYAGTLTLKGVTGDTGIPIQNNQPTVITFGTPTSANTFGLLASANVIVEVCYF